MDFNSRILGHEFNMFNTGSAGIYANSNFKYTVIEKKKHQTKILKPFHSSEKRNIISGIIYRHNSPQEFLEYFDKTLEEIVTSNKAGSIKVDFSIRRL